MNPFDPAQHLTGAQCGESYNPAQATIGKGCGPVLEFVIGEVLK